jgi:hypothetical protein
VDGCGDNRLGEGLELWQLAPERCEVLLMGLIAPHGRLSGGSVIVRHRKTVLPAM